MSIRSPSPPLPTFGIRGLAGPAKPPGLVSITKSQYDSTIRSTPDAKLLYLDDDDGELITVGSSFELSQRLDEPVVRHIPVDGKYVHIFDITHYSDSVAEWRDHEAYSSKTLRSRPGSRDLSSEDGSWPGHDFALAEPYRALPELFEITFSSSRLYCRTEPCSSHSPDPGEGWRTTRRISN